VLGASHAAWADGWKIQLQGAKALGLGYAGRALAEDASTVWFNAAGITALGGDACAGRTPQASASGCPRWFFTAGGALVPFTLRYADAGSFSVLAQPLQGQGTRDGGKTGGVPYFYVARHLAPHLTAGFGLNFPHGLSDDYGETWVGRYHATNSELQVANLNPVVAYRFAHPNVSVGAGLDIQHARAKLANMVDFGSYAALLGAPVVPQTVDGRIRLDASDWAVGYDLSVAWQATPSVRAAATYRSQVTHTLSGDADFDVPANAAFFTADGGFRDTAATTQLPMPRELSESVAVSITRKWTAVGDLTWTDWSQFDRLVVSFENPAQLPLTQTAAYEDSWRLAGGLVYRPNATWTLRGGALYEASPVPDTTRTPRLPEVNNTGVSAGASYRFSGRWDLDIGWSHLIPHDADIRLVDPTAGLLAGRIRWKTDAVAIGINTHF
jgi:long-chain fatty acid transport protein